MPSMSIEFHSYHNDSNEENESPNNTIENLNDTGAMHVRLLIIFVQLPRNRMAIRISGIL
jgi:hypothetical protein